MKKVKTNDVLWILLPFFILIGGCSHSQQVKNTSDMDYSKAKEDKEWKKILTPFQYSVLREGATERPFTGDYYNTSDTGTYFCAACGEKLFVSDTKFDSGCGWPSFFEPSSENSIVYREDSSLGMIRTEVLCGACGGHLGHVFKDGPPPTGLRYCINSAALRFEKGNEDAK